MASARLVPQHKKNVWKVPPNIHCCHQDASSNTTCHLHPLNKSALTKVQSQDSYVSCSTWGKGGKGVAMELRYCSLLPLSSMLLYIGPCAWKENLPTPRMRIEMHVSDGVCPRYHTGENFITLILALNLALILATETAMIKLLWKKHSYLEGLTTIR